MAHRIITCDQGSPEWFAARCGLVTASEFQVVMRQQGQKAGSESKTRRAYMMRLAGEVIAKETIETYQSAAMARGKAMEADIRQAYGFVHDVEPQLVGFIVNDEARAGCSPDSLVGDAGMLEIKTAQPNVLIEIILAGVVPTEHRAQLQGNLWIAEREWIDIRIDWPRMPAFERRVYRDDTFIAELEKAVRRFNEELDEIVQFVERYGRIGGDVGAQFKSSMPTIGGPPVF